MEMNREERTNQEQETMEKTNHVTGDMLIGQIVTEHPESIEALFAVGMHCIGCGASLYESLNDASFVHGLDPKMVLDAVNDRIDAAAAEAETQKQEFAEAGM